jgi:hypothetical protein
MMLSEAVDAEARSEGWMWWFLLVAGVVVLGLALMMLRRRLIRPMPHTPTDTSDAWAEAGRRLQLPPTDKEKPPSDEDAK